MLLTIVLVQSQMIVDQVFYCHMHETLNFLLHRDNTIARQ